MKIVTLTLNPTYDRAYLLPSSFEKGTLNRTALPSSLTLSGKGINVSRALLRLGVKSEALFISDETGDFDRRLSLEGLELSCVRAKRPVRMNISVLDSEGADTEINEAGGVVAKDELDNISKLFYGRSKDADITVISGSVPPGVPRDIYCDYVRYAKRRGSLVILDCDGDALRYAASAFPDIIKPNERELCELCPAEINSVTGNAARADAVRLCDEYYKKTGTALLCTLGKNGSVYTGVDGHAAVDAPRLSIRIFKGAGDTYLAGFIYKRFVLGESIENSMRFATDFVSAYLTGNEYALHNN